MGTETLTETERRLLAAVATAGSIKQADLKARGITVSPSSRAKLEAAGLLRVRAVGSEKKPVYWLDSTAKGAEVGAAPPVFASVSEGPRYGEAPYTIGERAVLLALMALAQPTPVAELKRTGLTIKPDLQKRLERDRLITVRSVPVRGSRKAAVTLELSDDGWAWASRELAAAAPEKPGPAGAALYALLAGLNRFLARNRLALADVFGDETLQRAAPTPPAPVANAANVEAQIRVAYRAACPYPGAWVSIADVRDRLDGAPREAVDAVLIRLYDARVANLMPNENLKTLTARDRASAIRLGDSDRHLMVME